MAKIAIKDESLTPWQAQQLLQGRWKGLRADRYELRDLLGQGSTGRVFLALDHRLDRTVALKFLLRTRQQTPQGLARFEREIKIAAQLQHENLVRIYNDGELNGVRFLVMEYIDGTPLAGLIKKHGRLPPEIAAEFARQIALGLDHLLERELLHRDVNPSNILVTRAGVAKLTDFGLAIEVGDPHELTREGSTIGTFDYLSPEQAWSSRALDIRSDIYSLGCSLFHMIAGHPPFPASTMAEILLAHQRVDPTPLVNLIPDCSPDLDAVVRRMLQKAPADRYQHPIEVAKALQDLSSGPVPLDQIQTPEPFDPTPGRPEISLKTAELESISGSGRRPSTARASSETQDDDVFPQIDLDAESTRGPFPPIDLGAQPTHARPASDRRILMILIAAFVVVGLIGLVVLLFSQL